jgi:hypothetical protein
MKKRALPAVRLFMGAALLLLGTACASSLPKDPMPPDPFLEVWEKEGDLAVYRGLDLYGYINGGSEVYLELGFRRCVVQHYSRGEEKVSVEIYYMLDPVAAMGIFLMNQGRNSTGHPAFAVRHTLHPYQLQFVKGWAYVLVNNLTETKDGEDVLLAFAGYAAQYIQPAPDIDFFQSLPLAGRVRGSERILRGPFTLERICTLGEGDVLLLDGNGTAVCADYVDGKGNTHTRILANYHTRDDAQTAFEHLKNNLDPYLDVLSSDNLHLTFRDYEGKRGEVKVLGGRIDIQVGLSL